ncbi:MAG TPA: hypothetical protein ENI80_10445 [Acidiferrobacteraceae bacterium]|nr:hypothetical protein [Acidiferrobacteraceae bacterium]
MINYKQSSRQVAALALASVLTACGRGPDTSSGGGGDFIVNSPSSAVRLNAFSDFKCTDGWTDSDGAMGLASGTGNGTCEAVFPGPSGTYRVEVLAQSEYDGTSSFAVGINRQIVYAGVYPLSQSSLNCNCSNWQQNCPDKVVMLDAGTHQIKTGDTLRFIGQEMYACSTSYGASAKWHELVFTRIN